VIRCKDKQKTGNGIVFVEKKTKKEVKAVENSHYSHPNVKS
jgi:hypothetical protein